MSGYYPTSPVTFIEEKRQHVKDWESNKVVEILRDHGWNITYAARYWGMKRQMLQRLMRRHGIKIPQGFTITDRLIAKDRKRAAAMMLDREEQPNA